MFIFCIGLKYFWWIGNLFILIREQESLIFIWVNYIFCIDLFLLFFYCLLKGLLVSLWKCSLRGLVWCIRMWKIVRKGEIRNLYYRCLRIEFLLCLYSVLWFILWRRVLSWIFFWFLLKSFLQLCTWNHGGFIFLKERLISFLLFRMLFFHHRSSYCRMGLDRHRVNRRLKSS